MMSKSRKIIMSVLLLVAVIFLAAITLESQAKIIRRSYNNFILDNRKHYFPCEKLPTEGQVRAIIQHHPDLIQAIEQVNPGSLGVEVDSSTCPGKADLVRWNASHQNRLAIETIMGGKTLFGVANRL